MTKMVSQSWSGGTGFPAYEGSFPRALRSSRGRGETFRKSRNIQKNENYFDLLATVAGLLHDAKTKEIKEENQLESCIIVRNSNGCDLKTESVSQEKGSMTGDKKDDSSKDQVNALLCALNTADEMVESSLVDTGKVKEVLSMDQEQFVRKEMTVHRKTGALEATTIQKYSVLEQISTTITTGDTLYSKLQKNKFDGFSSIKLSKDTESFNVAEELLLLNSCAKAEDITSNKMEIGSLVFGKDISANHREEMSLSGIKKLPTIQEGATKSLGSGFGDREITEGRDETGCFHNYGGWVKTEVQNDLILYDESPPMLSSGSSDEVPCLHRKPGDAHTLQVVKKEISCLILKDSDDNSSESVIPETVKSKASSLRVPQARRMANHAFKARDPVAGVKRKQASTYEHMARKSYGDWGTGMACSRQRKARCVPCRKTMVDKLPSASPTLLSNTRDVSMPLECDEDPAHPTSTPKIHNNKAANFVASPTSAAGPSSKLPSKRSGESNVRFSIKSFTVPELSVDLPESATIANLKRAVMDAAINLLGGGLCVRVLIQGKKVPDENASLIQAGISHNQKLDSLGFMLEPNPIPTSPTTAEDPILMLSCVANQARYPPILPMDGDLKNTVTSKVDVIAETNIADESAARVQTNLINKYENDMQPSSTTCYEPLVEGAGALILHPGLGGEGVQGLALVSMQQKSKSMEIGKRRMRRPFTVAEVEALVQAVEKLGTGRWRDVKLCAFEQAIHRTYVDLKDKWKTLVHTAHIAPYQRRGEPVPQELLDRVIQAHSYWTAQQAKRQAELSM